MLAPNHLSELLHAECGLALCCVQVGLGRGEEERALSAEGRDFSSLILTSPLLMPTISRVALLSPPFFYYLGNVRYVKVEVMNGGGLG